MNYRIVLLQLTRGEKVFSFNFKFVKHVKPFIKQPVVYKMYKTLYSCL